MIVYTAAYGHECCDAMGSLVALDRETLFSQLDAACAEEEDFCANNDDEPMECNLWTADSQEELDALGLTDEQRAELLADGYNWLDAP